MDKTVLFAVGFYVGESIGLLFIRDTNERGITINGAITSELEETNILACYLNEEP